MKRLKCQLAWSNHSGQCGLILEDHKEKKKKKEIESEVNYYKKDKNNKKKLKCRIICLTSKRYLEFKIDQLLNST